MSDTISSGQLQSVMDEFMGGSEGRFVHSLNRRFIYTEGAKLVMEKAGADWLLDLIALELAPVYAKAWLKGTVAVGIVVLAVTEAQSGHKAVLTLGLEDNKPPAVTKQIAFTDFPLGEWQFYLGTDEDGEGGFVTNLMVPAEY